MESGVDFEAVDFPQANRLTIHILAAVAEHEARMISERTKDGYKTEYTATAAGNVALRYFLAGLAEEESKP
jgi:hypothetical protein